MKLQSLFVYGVRFKYPLNFPHPHVKSLFSNFIFIIFQNPPTTFQMWPYALNTPSLVKFPKQPKDGRCI